MDVVIKTFILLIEAYVGQIAWPLHRILSNNCQCERSSYFNAQCSTTKLRIVYLFSSINMPVLIWMGTGFSVNNFPWFTLGSWLKTHFANRYLYKALSTGDAVQNENIVIMIRPDSGCAQLCPTCQKNGVSPWWKTLQTKHNCYLSQRTRRHP